VSQLLALGVRWSHGASELCPGACQRSSGRAPSEKTTLCLCPPGALPQSLQRLSAGSHTARCADRTARAEQSQRLMAAAPLHAALSAAENALDEVRSLQHAGGVQSNPTVIYSAIECVRGAVQPAACSGERIQRGRAIQPPKCRRGAARVVLSPRQFVRRGLPPGAPVQPGERAW